MGPPPVGADRHDDREFPALPHRRVPATELVEDPVRRTRPKPSPASRTMRDPGFLTSTAARCNHHATFRIRTDLLGCGSAAFARLSPKSGRSRPDCRPQLQRTYPLWTLLIIQLIKILHSESFA